MDLDFVSVHKHAKKELGQYPVILTSRLVNNPYVLTNSQWSGLGNMKYTAPPMNEPLLKNGGMGGGGGGLGSKEALPGNSCEPHINNSVLLDITSGPLKAGVVSLKSEKEG